MPTKEQFTAYVRVQYSGLWNMFSQEAMIATGLDKETYLRILRSYKALSLKYPEVIKEAQANG